MIKKEAGIDKKKLESIKRRGSKGEQHRIDKKRSKIDKKEAGIDKKKGRQRRAAPN
ncbi:hypothetical protein NCCP28_28920 [Niallia sp. NCCP-28]|nr:hypothetical protein NCCP28_28920 [Niallia sp. NCCP-28]